MKTFDLLVCDCYMALEVVKNNQIVPNLISISDPEQSTFTQTPNNVLHYLGFSCHDIDQPEANLTTPAQFHIDQLIQWSSQYQEGMVVVHCGAGVSRSTAATLIFLCERGLPPDQAVEYLKMIKPKAHPNRLMLNLYNNSALILATQRLFWDYWDARYESLSKQ